MKSISVNALDLRSDIRNPRSEIVLVLTGPTASGKTPVSIQLSRILDMEIISADSRQLYKHLDIGTAKPSKEELTAVPHHFIDIRSPEQDFNAGDFGKAARTVVDDIIKRKKTPVVVGGAGLYIRALIDGLFDAPSRDPGLRKKLEDEMKQEGSEALYQRLQEVDPKAAATMDAKKPRRIIRALEVHQLTGMPISRLQQNTDPLPHPVIMAGLQWDRKSLYSRIERRVDQMLEAGLLKEAENILAMGYDPSLNSLQTVGYKEAFQYLRGEMAYDLMVGLMKQNTRRYAKRQMTWFRAEKRIQWIQMGEGTRPEDAAATLKAMVASG